MLLSQDTFERLKQITDGNLPANMTEEKVVMVNERDEAIGIEDKTQAHLLGVLHRAFSVFVINAAGQLLVQRRALTKYHSRGLWSNTCCGHPRPDEAIEKAARRRLREEMGVDSDLSEVFDFVYRANLEDGFIENEYDHVLIGSFEGVPRPDPAEIEEWRWVDMAVLSADLKEHPKRYTYWFRISFDRVLQAGTPVESNLSVGAASSIAQDFD
ncbi:MAG: isopentenyl-diphosphate Delta-isomerase [Acidobacteriota bacterium]